MINEQKDKSIIDIGCGNGYISIPYLTYNHVTFLDLSKNMLEETKRNIPEKLINNAEFCNTSIEKYNQKNNFDVVLLIGVLAHVENVENCISQISKLIKKKGICIVQVTNYDKFIAKTLITYSKFRKLIITPKSDYDTNIMSRDSVVNVFLKYGFSLIDEKSYFPSFPGFRFLTQKTRIKLLMKTYDTKLASIISSELLFKFTKTD